MWSELTLTISGIITGGFSGWFFGRKRNNAEVTGIDINSAKEIVGMHRDLNMQLKTELNNSQQLIKEHQRIIQHFSDKCVQIKTCRLQ